MKILQKTRCLLSKHKVTMEMPMTFWETIHTQSSALVIKSMPIPYEVEFENTFRLEQYTTKHEYRVADRVFAYVPSESSNILSP